MRRRQLLDVQNTPHLEPLAEGDAPELAQPAVRSRTADSNTSKPSGGLKSNPVSRTFSSTFSPASSRRTSGFRREPPGTFPGVQVTPSSEPRHPWGAWDHQPGRRSASQDGAPGAPARSRPVRERTLTPTGIVSASQRASYRVWVRFVNWPPYFRDLRAHHPVLSSELKLLQADQLLEGSGLLFTQGSLITQYVSR